MKLNYFAFGSNLASQRLLQRIPAASVGCVATLAGHRLCWRKNDRGQSGKCDIDFTADPEHLVYGVVYHMTAADKLELDRDVFERHVFRLPLDENARAGWTELKPLVAAAVRKKTLDEWRDLLEGTDVCFAPVLTLDEAVEHPHNMKRGAFVRVDGNVQTAG